MRKIQEIQSKAILQRLVQGITAAGVVFALLLGTCVCAFKYQAAGIPYIFLSMGIVFVCVCAAYFMERLGAWSLAVVGVIALGSRLLMLAVWNLPPQNDFLTTYEIALRLSEVSFWQWGSVLSDIGQLYRDYWCVHMPFILSETAVLKIFGGGYVSIQIVFAFFSAGSCVLTALLGEKVFGKRIGILAGLLYIFQPTALFFTSVLSNQHMAVFFCLFGLYFIVAKPLKSRAANSILAGTALAFSQLARPEMYVVLVAVACYEIYVVLTVWRNDNTKIVALIKTAVLKMASMFFIFFAILLLCNVVLTGTGLIKGSMFEGNFSYKIAVGMNAESQGEWNASDAEVCNDSEELNRRIRERLQQPGKLAALVLKKEGVLLGSYDYGWCTEGKSGYIAEKFFPLMSEAYMLLILLCAIAACIYGFKSNPKEQMLLELFLFGFFLIFALIEVQNRYNFLFLPALCILASGNFVLFYKKVLEKNVFIDRVSGKFAKKV